MSERPLDLLVTGFGPFPRVPRNPTERLARQVASSGRLRRAGVTADALVLTTAYAALENELRPALTARCPRAILMLGVAARARRVRLETRALNRQSLLFPDAAGRVGRSAALMPALPLALRGRGALPTLLRALNRHGLKARLSIDAGRYLCNAGYFAALMDMPAAVPVVFVHVPMPRTSGRRRDPRPRFDAMEQGLTALALALAAAGRRAGHGPHAAARVRAK